ncbi:Eco57I restriction-modification methylase domain-containing protein [Cylindrospermopsis raciborskii]|uniref:Eco57I restriction-modification methylase domain-containing protein n=1 Tax=Cylindrospermopsis raciborskii TaxID=77022 RepID=UPI000C9DE0F7|nr:N-6 DNA methylase [Cylindrospermopsis raciborskii]PNK16947.1 hypothetical protein CEP07_10180 [Cylindrospermopsis raciborskii S01]
MKLNVFDEIDFLPALKAFFRGLNVPINYVDDKPTSVEKILENTYKGNEGNESFGLINDVYFLGLVDDATFRGNKSLEIDQIKSDYDGILIFGVTFGNRQNGLLPTRSQLAEISRAFNREFFYTPVVVVFRYDKYLAFANTERLKYKDNREGEKAGKVTLLRDIDIRQPHSGHERILAELAIPKQGKDRVASFAELYKYWQKVLDVNLLNRQFYQEVSAWYFHACKQVVFPKDAKNNQESLIRLITRLMFVWFLKEKGLVPSELFNGTDIRSILKSLEPQESTYYKAILQNLFFATLNTEGKREFIKESSGARNSQFMVHNVFRYRDYFQNPDEVINRYFAKIPFLNGGLFECLDTEPEKNKPETAKRIDGFSNNPKNVLLVPNELFFGDVQDVDLNADFGTSRKKYRVRGLLEIFKSYKFTIAENTPFEEDVALDPELLGQVFENLLAAYNPETQTTARKQTGSFYTPREIVNYMVDESLIVYFKEKLKSKKGKFREQDFDGHLRLLLDYQSSVNPFEDDPDVTSTLIEAIDNCKILDPACGSGAFPMGILQKMVYVLRKLDHKNLKWQELQRLKVQEETNRVFYIGDKDERQRRLIEINEAFDEKINDPNYGRKLFLMENCIYGVDIQPIALQIAKLRCFIALIVEQVVDRNRKNSGILPLPNLETKFVAANSLIRFNDQNLRRDEVILKEQELKEIRKKHFTARSKATKDKYRERDQELRNEIRDLLKDVGLDGALADSLAQWSPYNQNSSANFFDPEWMFGISHGFDIVIGNLPYIRIQDIQKSYPTLAIYLKDNYVTASGSFDLYCCFIERAISLKKTTGSIAYIVPHKFFQGAFGKPLRGLIAKQKMLNQIVDFGSSQVFDSATTYTCLLFLSNGNEKFKFVQLGSLAQNSNLYNILDLATKENNIETELVKVGTISSKKVSEKEWNFTIGDNSDILSKIKSQPRTLADVCSKIFQGIATSADKVYFLEHISEKDGIITAYSKSLNQEVKIERAFVKPLLKGADVHRYQTLNPKIWCVFPYKFQNNKALLYTQSEIQSIFPKAWQYLLANRTDLEARESGKMIKDQFYAYIYPKNLTEFEREKIVTPDIASGCQMTLDYDGLYHTTTIYSFVFKQDTKESLKYYLSLLNSQILWYFLTSTGSVLRGNYFRFKTNYLMPFPIPDATTAEQRAIETLVGYVLHLTAALKHIPIHPTTLDWSVSHKRMNRYFEEIIDALVMELYLPEDLHTYDKYFMRYILSESLPPIETIQGDKTEKLRQIFGQLFDNEHPIRHNLFLLNTIPVVRNIEGKL